jgi:hypothetical protein
MDLDFEQREVGGRGEMKVIMEVIQIEYWEV